MVGLESIPDPDHALRLIEEKLGVGVWIWRCRERKLQWSRGMYPLFDLDPREGVPLYERAAERVHPDDRYSTREFEQSIGEGHSLYRKFRVVKPDGGIRWLFNSAEVVAGADGGPSHAIGILQDVTEEHENDRLLASLSKRLRALVALADGVVFTAMPGGTVVDISSITDQKAADYAQQFTGLNWARFVHPDDLPEVQKAIERAKQRGHKFEVEHRAMDLSGSYRWRLTRALGITDENGAVQEYVGMSRDIHGKKLHQDSKSKAAFVGGAQIRAARAILHWSVKDLAEAADVSASTIRRFEEIDGPPKTYEPSLEVLKSIFEDHGIDFFVPAEGSPGVRKR